MVTEKSRSITYHSKPNLLMLIEINSIFSTEKVHPQAILTECAQVVNTSAGLVIRAWTLERRLKGLTVCKGSRVCKELQKEHMNKDHGAESSCV